MTPREQAEQGRKWLRRLIMNARMVGNHDLKAAAQEADALIVDLLALLTAAEGERDTLRKDVAILKLSVSLEEELSNQIDEMLKYLAMEQGFTLHGIARLLVDVQRRMAADWVDVGGERKARQVAEGERDRLQKVNTDPEQGVVMHLLKELNPECGCAVCQVLREHCEDTFRE